MFFWQPLVLRLFTTVTRILGVIKYICKHQAPLEADNRLYEEGCLTRLGNYLPAQQLPPPSLQTPSKTLPPTTLLLYCYVILQFIYLQSKVTNTYMTNAPSRPKIDTDDTGGWGNSGGWGTTNNN
ncbi:hypothetical protein PHLCEN_2v775 [Hermanssonia centrifuga]|uniref:Uncharacterized protein n=1 Tax=Hermanssonia centrifuga TaxID=98765 RepID=A0A2R6S516_9APHY|nr:hypothetical protein PHLCEN_2v775 [Hermanssonia centrifuga]